MSPADGNILELDEVCLELSGREILDDISFSLKPRQIITIIGPNGAGKTSLLKVIAGIYSPSSGAIKKAPGLKIGYVPQKVKVDFLLPMKVGEFVDYNDSVLEYLEILSLKNSYLYTLSGGELQRVILARALNAKPGLLVLDEPVQSLDIGGALRFYEMLNKIKKEQDTGIIMVSHDLNVVMKDTNEVICLHKHICCHGRPEHISSTKEFAGMFGREAVDSLALYQHHHNHTHGV